MSKLFFKGRIETRQNHVLSGYNVNRAIKAGTEEAPINIVVPTELRKQEIETITQEHSIVANITVDESQEENTIELDTLLNKAKTTVFEKNQTETTFVVVVAAKNTRSAALRFLIPPSRGGITLINLQPAYIDA